MLEIGKKTPDFSLLDDWHCSKCRQGKEKFNKA